MRKLEPVTIDARRHDAVLFDFKAVVTADGSPFASAPTLVRRLHDAGIGTGVFSADPECREALVSAGIGERFAAVVVGDPVEAAACLAVQTGRCVVVAAEVSGVRAARAGGFALVIGVDPTEQCDALLDAGADTVIADLRGVAVRTGDLRMSQLTDALRAQDLGTGRPAVFYDFDGTLSDIVNDPDSASLVAGAAEALRELAARCPVAVLSGRDLADVTKRVGLPGIWYAGSHGFELTAPDGTHHQNDAAAAAIPVLEQAAAQLREEFASIPGVVVEHKRYGVAVHYRNAARDRVGEVAAAVRAAARRDALRVTTGREVVELRPGIDWDKGKTLRWVMDHLQEAGPVPPVPIYLGDDITDEDAFDAVRAGPVQGYPILVRHNEDGDRATAALYALDSPAQVSEFTKRLARRIPGASAN